MPAGVDDASFERLLGHAESEFRKRRHGSEAKRAALAERQAFEHELQISQSSARTGQHTLWSHLGLQEKMGAHTRRRSPLERFLIDELDVLLESSAHGKNGTSLSHTPVCVPSTWCIRPEVLSETACAVMDLPVEDSSFQQLLECSEPNMGKERRGAKAAALVERRMAQSTRAVPPTPSSQSVGPPTPCTRSSVHSTPMHGVFSVQVGRPSSAGGAGGSNVVRGPDAQLAAAHGACGGGPSPAYSRRFARLRSTSQSALRHLELASSRRSSGAPSSLPASASLGRSDIADAAGGSNVARGSDAVHRSIQASCRVDEGQSELCGGGELPVRGHRFARPRSAQTALGYLESPAYPWGTTTELGDVIIARQQLGRASPTRSACSRAMPASTLSANDYIALPPEPLPPHRNLTASDGQLQSEGEVQMLRHEALASKVAEGEHLSEAESRMMRGEAARDEAWSAGEPRPVAAAAALAPTAKNTVGAWAWRCDEG